MTMEKVDTTNKFRVIEKIEDEWDDVQVVLITRESLDEQLTEWYEVDPLGDDDWSYVKSSKYWKNAEAYLWDYTMGSLYELILSDIGLI